MASSMNANGKRPADNIFTNSPKTIKDRYKKSTHVCVGHQKELFVVHREPICERSAFFEARCSPAWSKAGTPTGDDVIPFQLPLLEDDMVKQNPDIQAESLIPTVELPDQDPDDFSRYLDSVYDRSRDLVTPAQQVEKDYEVYHDQATKKRVTCIQLCNLWVLADYLMDPTCKAMVIENLVRENYFHVVPPCDTIYKAVYSTRPGSGLRKLLVETILHSMPPDLLHKSWGIVPSDMKRDLLSAAVPEISLGSHLTFSPTEKGAARYYD